MTQRTSVPEAPPGHEPSDAIHTETIPGPTVWPSALALGITLLAGGLVMNPFVVTGGLVLTLAGVIGWVRDLMTDSLDTALASDQRGPDHERPAE